MKRLSLVLILALSALGVFAQESAGAGRTTTFVRNGFWDNWFVSGGAGTTLWSTHGGDQGSKFTDRFSGAYNLSLGKWVSPIWGGRIVAGTGAHHTFYKAGTATRMNHNDYITVQGDVLWNVSNYFGKYNAKRVYSFIPFLGAGVGRAFTNDYKNRYADVLTIHGGIINNFRLSNRLNLFVEVSTTALPSDFRGFDPLYNAAKNYNPSKRYGLLNTALAGLTLNLGKTGFQEAVLQDQSLIDNLNGQINRLRSENAELSKRPVSCPPCPEAPAPQTVVETKNVYVPNVVFFRLNSAVVEKNQEVSIYNTAEYLKNNPSAKVKVVAYADKKTGTVGYNEKLSEKRAKNVAKILTNKYNIDSSRVDVEWKGSSEQPYAKNDWNRVAIFIANN